MMRAGISTASLFLKRNNEDALPFFQREGVKDCEIFFTSFCEYKKEFAELLLKEKKDVSVNSVHVLNTQFEPQLYAVHPKVLADAYGLLKETMESAQLLGAKYYTFHGIARIKRSSLYNNFSQYGPQTAKIYEFCKSYGVELSYENVEWALYHCPGVFTKLKEYCPDLKGTLDVKQARISGYDYREYLKEMGESISHVHVSDIDENGKMCLPGKGVFDFKELLERLRDVGFDGCVLIEAYAGDYKEEKELIDSYHYVSELIDRVR